MRARHGSSAAGRSAPNSRQRGSAPRTTCGRLSSRRTGAPWETSTCSCFVLMAVQTDSRGAAPSAVDDAANAAWLRAWLAQEEQHIGRQVMDGERHRLVGPRRAACGAAHPPCPAQVVSTCRLSTIQTAAKVSPSLGVMALTVSVPPRGGVLARYWALAWYAQTRIFAVRSSIGAAGRPGCCPPRPDSLGVVVVAAAAAGGGRPRARASARDAAPALAGGAPLPARRCCPASSGGDGWREAPKASDMGGWKVEAQREFGTVCARDGDGDHDGGYPRLCGRHRVFHSWTPPAGFSLH